MSRVKFTDVGRRKACWEAEAPSDDSGFNWYDWLYVQVKLRGNVMSRNLDFLDNGAILAGFHTIGKFEILEA